MKQRKDTLFASGQKPEDFQFTSRVAEVFDDMLDRSVPFYQEVIQATAALLKERLKTGDSIYDLGSSTGTTLLQLSRALQQDDLHYIGIDSSPAMLEKAQLKSELYAHSQQFHFLNEDITKFDHQGAGAVIMNYTLQFIRPLQRPALLKKIFNCLRPGGTLILSEKTICASKELNRSYIDIYHNFKKSKGYSELEIAQKREALENVLIPFSIHENRELLKEVGFTNCETFFQWFNFCSFVATKPK